MQRQVTTKNFIIFLEFNVSSHNRLFFTADFIPTVANKLPPESKKKIGIIAGAIVGAGMISILVIAIILIIRRKRKTAADEEGKYSLKPFWDYY